MSLAEGSFDFVEVNPRLSGLAFAAEEAGGVRVGVTGLPPAERAAYEAYFGRGAAEPAADGCDIVLAELPFSMFVAQGSVDPAVSDTVRDALLVAMSGGTRGQPRAAAMLLRAPWADARRLGVEAEGYRAAVEAAVGTKSWTVSSAVTDDGNDLFVAAVSLRFWNGREPLPAVYPRRAFVPLDRNPQEIVRHMGYPAKFALRYAGASPTLVYGITDVGNARMAVDGLLAAVR